MPTDFCVFVHVRKGPVLHRGGATAEVGPNAA